MVGCQLKVPDTFENCSTQPIAFWTDIVWKIEQFSKCITYAFQSQVMWYFNVDQNNNNQPKLWPLGGQFVCTCLFVWFYLLLDVFEAKLEIRFPLCWFAPQNLCIPIKLKKLWNHNIQSGTLENVSFCLSKLGHKWVVLGPKIGTFLIKIVHTVWFRMWIWLFDVSTYPVCRFISKWAFSQNISNFTGKPVEWIIESNGTKRSSLLH